MHAATGVVQRVLIVEDDDSLRSLLTRMLTHNGFATSAAVDGQHAIEMLSKDRWDAIILDIMMPRVDGYGVLAFLREKFPEMLNKTVIATAMRNATKDPRLQDAAAIIEKPFRVTDVIDTVRNCCTGTLPNSRRGTRDEG